MNISQELFEMLEQRKSQIGCREASGKREKLTVKNWYEIVVKSEIAIPWRSRFIANTKGNGQVFADNRFTVTEWLQIPKISVKRDTEKILDKW